MPTASTLHITPDGDAWAVRLGEDETPASVHATQGQAVAGAWEMASNLVEVEVLVHGADGRVRSSLTIRQFEPATEVLQAPAPDEGLADDEDDPAARAEALRITPSNDRLRAMIGKFPLPTGDYENEGLPC